MCRNGFAFPQTDLYKIKTVVNTVEPFYESRLSNINYDVNRCVYVSLHKNNFEITWRRNGINAAFK